MELSKKIGNNIKICRDNYGYTQEQIAKLLDVERSTVSKYESGDREISIIHLNKLADLYGIELEDFMVDDAASLIVNLAFAFRKSGIADDDIKSIAEFQKVVKNYLKIEKIIQENNSGK